MSFQPDQLRALIVSVLKNAATAHNLPYLYSEDVVELLMMTAAQESLLGKYIEQIKGPALGIFQMEPATLRDMHDNYLRYKPYLTILVEHHMAKGVSWEDQMKGNLPLQIIMARLFYLRVREALPDGMSKHAMAKYYKKYFNTVLGKATTEEAIRRYEKYAAI